MATKHKSSFRGKVGKDAQKSIRTSRGYLNLPDGIKQYQVEENTKKVTLDILPYIVTDSKHPNRDEVNNIALKGDLWYKRPFKVHRNVGVDNESFVCPKSFGKPCPICEYQKKRFNEGADKEETKELYPKDRNLYVVSPLEDKKLEGIFVWDMSQALFQDILKESLEEDSENEVFPDLEEGRSLELSFKWKTFGKSTFPEVRNINFLDRETPYDESILEKIPDLDSMLKVLSYEELSNKFFELEGESDGGALEEPITEKEEPIVERKRKDTPPKEDVADAPTWDELLNLSLRNLSRICKRLNLDLSPEGYEDDEDGVQALREDMAKELGLTIPKITPTKTTNRERPTKETPTNTNPCPFKHRFGLDCEKFDDCDTCDLWNACLDAKEGK